MRDYDDYDDQSIRLYTPVFQRVIILAAVVIAVPVLMWTITTFVRSYVARPKVPALEHLASTNPTVRIPAISPAPPSPAPSPADQSAPQRVEGASASDAANPAAALRRGPPNLASLPDASPSPGAASGPPAASLQAAPIPAPSPAIAAPAATATSDATASVASVPRAPQVPRSADSAAATSTPSPPDRGIAWPNPNATSPPDFAAPRLPPPPPSLPPARSAAAEAAAPDEPVRGPVPLPRQRPGVFAIAASGAASGAVPLPRARPVDAPDEAASTAVEVPAGGRSDLENAR